MFGVIKLKYFSLLFFYCAGSFLLPRGDFAYIEQIPQLYHDFCTTNEEDNFFEFIEEQFFEFEFSEDEPASGESTEKEPRPVPFYALSASSLICLPQFEVTNISVQPLQETKYAATYILTDYWVYPSSVFHPPKA